MNKWNITTANRTIEVQGKDLETAVKRFGKKHPRMKIECGFLVRVRKLTGSSKIQGYGYWDAKKFLECLG